MNEGKQEVVRFRPECLQQTQFVYMDTNIWNKELIREKNASWKHDDRKILVESDGSEPGPSPH